MDLHWTSGFHAPEGRPVDGLAYEQYIGRWSRPFVPALLAAAEVKSDDRVLDVAAGIGEAAAVALAAVGNAGVVIGMDISLAMGLMFFPDPSKGLAEFRRVVRPGSRAAVCVISSPNRAPMWGLLADALSHELPEQSAKIYLSFSLADVARLHQLFIASGFRDVLVQRETHEDTVSAFDAYSSSIEAGYRTHAAVIPGLAGSCAASGSRGGPRTFVSIRIAGPLPSVRRDVGCRWTRIGVSGVRENAPSRRGLTEAPVPTMAPNRTTRRLALAGCPVLASIGRPDKR